MLYGYAASVPMASSMDDTNAKKYIIKPDRSLIYLYRDEYFGSENEVYGGLFICTCYALRRTASFGSNCRKWMRTPSRCWSNGHWHGGRHAYSGVWRQLRRAGARPRRKTGSRPEVGITACPVPSPTGGKPLSRGDPSLLLNPSGQAPTEITVASAGIHRQAGNGSLHPDMSIRSVLAGRQALNLFAIIPAMRRMCRITSSRLRPG